MDEIPEGEEWVFHIPRELLDEEHAINPHLPDSCGLLVLTVKSDTESDADTDDADEEGEDDNA